jgi:hypothetical protein
MHFPDNINTPADYYNFTCYFYGFHTRSVVTKKELKQGDKKCDAVNMDLRRKKEDNSSKY